MKYLQTIILMLTVLVLFGCEGYGRTVRLDEEFTLKSKESATIEDTDIEITVNRIGRKWLKKGGEKLDFTFSVKNAGKTKSYANPLPPLIVAGDYKIEVVKTNPFGEGSATFIVKKKDLSNKSASNDSAPNFVAQFGWHIVESISSTDWKQKISGAN